jgi:predicted AAA+ superfamily ATPase
MSVVASSINNNNNNMYNCIALCFPFHPSFLPWTNDAITRTAFQQLRHNQIQVVTYH